MSFFNDNLRKLDFDVESQEARAVILVSQITDKDLTSTEVFALEEAKKFNADAVYFRHFPDTRPPLPQIYIYDGTQREITEEELAIIHRDLWSYSRIPMFIVIEKTDVKIFDTREPVDVLGEKGEIIKNRVFDTLRFSDDAIKLYSREMFDSGIFWETEKAKGHFLESKSSYQDLINELRKIRIKFTEKFKKDAPRELKTFNKLLVFSILVKYLEERGGLFAEDFFRKIGSQNYCDALRNGNVFKLFGELSRHFNGRIFEWTQEEEEIITSNNDLTKLIADFLDADVDTITRDQFFWKRYSFNHLPVALISTVYETFLSEHEDAVFTPEFLVNTLLDEAMPQSDYEKTAFKTIDVSCGSGIFLVGAFKRLAQRHRYLYFQETRKLVPAKPEDLLKIIKDNIFGVDIEEESIRLTVFSLCLALCDELTPKQIWTELKFDKTFQTNFRTKNFFEYLEENESELVTWDLVIGNPPFNGLSIEKNKNGEYFGKFSGKQSQKAGSRKRIKLNEEIVQKYKQKIYPDNQIALMFLDQVPRLLKEDGIVCLILPSAPLLYNNSLKFRKDFFRKYQVLQILDFTNLDSILFGKADVPTAALFARKKLHQKEIPITHVTIRRTKTSEQKMLFEVDKYDFHLVSQYDAVCNKHIWKCNLLGGGRLHNTITRLSNLDTIKDFINANNWSVGAGYEIGPLDKQVKTAPYITQHRTLPTIALTENGADKSQIVIETAEKFHRISDEKLFTPPHLLIKRNIGLSKIPTYFSDEYLTFKKIIIGISAPENEREQLLELSNAFDKNRAIYKLFITATSNEYLVGRATTLHNQDIMNLPYPEDKEELNLSFAEQILCDDVLKYYSEIKAKSSRAKFNQNAHKNDLESFGSVFTKALNSIYEQSDKCFYLKKIYDWSEYFITEFGYGEFIEKADFEKVNEPTQNIKSLIENQLGRNFSLIRSIRINEKNKFSFIKPKALRYWLRSIALRDADETFSDLIKAGY
jgi:hypothetical protein